jgi:uncharacterized membrane protein YhdT
MPSTAGAGRRRFAQANREALITLILYLAYFIWWYACGYGLGSGDPQDYTYICGFPAWFFFSCVVGFPVVSLALWLTLRLFFRKMPLDPRMPEQASSPPLSSDSGPGRD